MTTPRTRARSGAGHVRRRPCPASCTAPEHTRCRRTWEWRFSHDGRVYTGGAATERDAHARMRVAQAEAAAGKLLTARERREREQREREAERAIPTVEAFALSYLARRGALRPRTLEAYRSLLAHHVVPTLGSRRIDSITRRDVRQLLEGLADPEGAGLARPTCARVRSLLGAIFGAAVEDELVSDNPARGVRLPERAAPGRAGEVRAATPEQTEAMLRLAAGHDLEPIVRFIAATGVRRSEAVGLRWANVDLESGVVVIAEAVHHRGGGILTCPPKSKAGARSVALDGETLAWLRTHRAEQSRQALIFGRHSWNPKGYVFTRADGSPVRPDTLTHAVRRWFAAAGAPGLGVHSLRHGWATTALAAGADIKVVSASLGHSSTTLTRDVYQHSTPELARQAAEMVAALRRTAAAPRL